MVQYKLHYFDARGRAELARLLFAYAGVEFEDYRWTFEEWPQHKPKMPFGQAPVLEVDGKMLAQSFTIARFLAKTFGLTGKDDWEAALADMYVDNISDMHNVVRLAYHEKDEAKKKEIMENFMKNNVAPHLEKVEQRLKANATGYLVGDGLTWADIAYYNFFTNLTRNAGDDFLKTAPQLHSLINKVGEIPSIKKWVETRPVTAL